MTEVVVEERFSLIKAFKKIPFSTKAVGALYLVILILGLVNGFSFSRLLSDSLHLFGVWALFSLANVPSIQAGTGPNFALPIGIVNGLLAMVLVLAAGFTGMGFIVVASLVAIIFGSASGFLYGKLMNAVKGSEMAIAPYTGFAITAVFGLVWLSIPIRHPNMIFFLGDGLRHQIPLDYFRAEFILANFLFFEIFGLEIRTGELIVVVVACVLMWLFFRSKMGLGITAVGRNPKFAKASGVNVDRSRVIANMISTAVAALGVIVYAQGFGFIQLYDFPMLLAFPAVACIVVGGASGQKANVRNVVIGTFLFQGLMAIALPVFTRVLAGGAGAGIVGPIRMAIQNGIILYALSRMSKGGK
ncbi:MAG: ABC transporter permease [Defluviitaleaceae bacterium]|nr:ABC transporter permease [Defluviitaleaceae bacterium]